MKKQEKASPNMHEVGRLGGQTTLERPEVAGKHPAVFPVQLPLEVVEAFSDPGDLVYEPFLGSGTTMIAAEQCARVVCGCEREPGYVDICLARWEQATGKTARLADG